MKTVAKILTTMCLLIATNAQANLIANGGFQSCNFSGWDTYTDGTVNTEQNGDFNIINNAGECQAEINIDFNNGATAFEANTLSAALDLTATANSQLWLSFDWDFSGFDNESVDADWFFVNFINDLGEMVGPDGELGFLIDPTSAYGAGTFSMMLDSSMNNQTGWFLDFNLEGGFTADSFSSTLLIDNITLTAIPHDVPAPPLTALLLLSTAALFTRRAQSNRTH
ncbi:hypothetical protein [Paraglaciecola arctica]|uniref:hypothetical protein n=1 Tax=Paraglaciecola arctica TaxID=1128911 RepID=UPI001C067E50|nr:hypothetical protein [Paraglaciecola arctica]